MTTSSPETPITRDEVRRACHAAGLSNLAADTAADAVMALLARRWVEATHVPRPGACGAVDGIHVCDRVARRLTHADHVCSCGRGWTHGPGRRP